VSAERVRGFVKQIAASFVRGMEKRFHTDVARAWVSFLSNWTNTENPDSGSQARPAGYRLAS